MLKSGIFTMYRTIRSWTKNQEVKSPSSFSHEIFHHYNTLCSWQKVKNAFLLRAAGQVETGRSSPCRCRLLSPRWLTIPWPVRPSACPALPAAHRCPVIEHVGPRLGTVVSQVCKWHDASHALCALGLIFAFAWWVLKKLHHEGMSYSIPSKFFPFSRNLCLTWLSSLLPHIPGTDLFTQLCFISEGTFYVRKWRGRANLCCKPAAPAFSLAGPSPPHSLSFPCPPLSLPLLLIESLEIWNQLWNYSLQLPPRSQISEETSLSPLPT